MEKMPKFRVVGNASEDTKTEVKKEIVDALFAHLEELSSEDQERLKRFEYPKTEKELTLIDFANKETGELMQQVGVKPYDIPADNYHIVPSELYKEYDRVSDGTATTLYTKQGMWFNAEYARRNPVSFGTTALHETLHLKGHFSVEANETKGEIDKTPYRQGVGVRAIQKYGLHGKYHEHFLGLHEAIVSMQQKKSTARLLDVPALADEKKWLTSEKVSKLKKKIAEKENLPEDDIVWVGKKGERDWKAVAYLEQRQVLEYVCAEIQKQFPEQFSSIDGVYKEFLRAHFSGRLITIGRLVEETFGKGSFRLLGNMSDEKESAVLHLESLRKARVRQVRTQTA